MIYDPRSLCLCLLLGTASPAFAQDIVGGGLAVIPRYPGSADHRVMPAPFVHFERGPFFISNDEGLPGLGLKARVAPDLDVGVQVGPSLGRPENRSPRLAGLGDIDASARFGVFARWTPGRWSASLSYNRSSDSDYGGALDLRGSYAVFAQGPHAVRLGASLDWGDSDYMQTWFGITPQQSANSRAGLPAYRVSSGLSAGSAYASWRYRLNARWGVNALLGVQTLLGDAADSPVVERKTSAFGAFGITYAF